MIVTQLNVLLISGRHCCLWCLIRLDQLKKVPADREPILLRTISSICDDHQRFVTAGASQKSNVKLFNNCLLDPIFTKFPLTQVATCIMISNTDIDGELNSYRCVRQGFISLWESSRDCMSSWRVTATSWMCQ